MRFSPESGAIELLANLLLILYLIFLTFPFRYLFLHDLIIEYIVLITAST